MQMRYSNNNINIKNILTHQETQHIPFDTIPYPLSLKLVKILRNFLFTKFSVSNERLLWKWNSMYLWLFNVPLAVMLNPQ